MRQQGRQSDFTKHFRQLADAQLGYLAFDWLTIGQLLSLPMIIAGMALLFFAL